MKISAKISVCIFLLMAGLSNYAMPKSSVAVIEKYSPARDSMNYRQFQISFIPYFGTNGFMTDSIVNNVSINILAGYVYEVQAAEFGGMFNIVKRNMTGCQLSGMGNIVLGKTTGLQGAGMFNVTQSMDGMQIAGLLNTTRYLRGYQISGLANHALTGCGAQIASLVNNATDSAEFQIAGLVNNAPVVKTFQLSGLVNNACKETGFQIAGLVNNAVVAKQFQISGLANNTSSPTNMQLAGLVNNAREIGSCQVSGLVNNATNVTGVQIAGLVNRANCVRGTQIAFINIADSCSGLPIGVLNFIKNGYHKLELSADEMFYTNIAYRSGIKKFHGILSAGIAPDNFDKPLWTYGVGVGTSVDLSTRMLLDVDLMFQNVIKSDEIADNYLYKIYVGTDWQVFPKASLFFGVSYNFLVSDTKDKHYNTLYSDVAPYTFTDHTYRSVNLKTWAGFKAGIRLF